MSELRKMQFCRNPGDGMCQSEREGSGVKDQWYERSKTMTDETSAPAMVQPKGYPHAKYDAIVAETFKKIVDLGIRKGGEYAGDNDRLANFRRNAERMGVRMELIWGVYAAKHWDAVMQYVADVVAGKTRDRMEPIEGRVDDLIVYLLLFKAILDESKPVEVKSAMTGEIRPLPLPEPNYVEWH